MVEAVSEVREKFVLMLFPSTGQLLSPLDLVEPKSPNIRGLPSA